MSWLSAARESLRPPSRLSLSEWADRHYYLSAESSAETGRWKTLPYQRGPMDAMTDPDVEQVTLMKSARVGGTKMLNALIGYHIDHDPCPIMVVQPSLKDARGYSNEEIAPMIRDCPRLTNAFKANDGETKKSKTILDKYFVGGSLGLVGANSGEGFRRVTRRVVLFDEVDAYPESAGDDGDPITLGINRTKFFANRKIVAISTPLIEGASRITELFLKGDQRRYHVPCSGCGHMDFLAFRKKEEKPGHVMMWPRNKPEDAYFVCSKNGCVMEHHDKFAMLEGGEWIAEKEFNGHASFHIWEAYSVSPNSSWGDIAKAFIEASAAGAAMLRTFINTVLGETFAESGEAPDWEMLRNRRELYQAGTLPEGAPILAITCAVDVQVDRWVYESVGWCGNKESYSIEKGIIYGNTANEEEWSKVDELRARTYSGMPIRLMAVDSGNWTQTVYNWCSKYDISEVIAVKGRHNAYTMVSPPSDIEIKANGKRAKRGYKLWNVGVSIAKTELYRWLRLKRKENGEYPPGYCHFPEYDDEFFLQLTGEHKVKVRKRNGRVSYEWKILPGRENHFLDTRVYNRAAAYVLGLDRYQGNNGGSKPRPKAPPRNERDRERPEPWPSRPLKRDGWTSKKRDRR